MYLEFKDGSRLGEFLHDGLALLLSPNGNNKLQTVSRPWTGRVKYISAKAKNNLGLAAIFVRPDSYVAWQWMESPANPKSPKLWPAGSDSPPHYKCCAHLRRGMP